MLNNQVIALSAITQACLFTAQAARHGSLIHRNLEPLVQSLFNMNPVDTASVYGDVSALSAGLNTFIALNKGEDHLGLSADILRYQFGVLYLESRLHKNKRMLDRIGAGLEDIARDFPDASSRSESSCILRVSGLYQNTVSTLKKRLQVKGDFKYLNQDDISASIRTSLLAGIRAAVLWRQVGGRRWQLLLKRQALVECAEQMQKQL